MTRVLLTGAGGFVGHHTLEHLLVNTDWDVVCIDSFRHAGKTDRITEVIAGGPYTFDQFPIWADRVTVITHDLIAPFSTQMAEKIGPLDAIISMASESHVDRSISDPVPFIKNNVDLVLNLLEFQRTYTPDAIFLQVSTDEVYGPAPEGHNHGEWEPHLPSNPYSASKSAQEQIAFSYWRTFGVPLILTSTMNIIGERQDPEKYVPMLIQRIRNGETVTIHASPEGQPGSRFYLHARNQADALMSLIGAYLTGGSQIMDYDEPGTSLRYRNGDVRPPKYNIVGEKEINNLQLAELVAKYVGNDLKYELIDFHSQRPGHDLRYALDGTKIAKTGWKAPISLEDSLKKTVEWSLEHPQWLLP